MGKQKRKRMNAEGKIKVLQRHFMEKRPVSEVCEEFGIQPSVFYSWQRDLFARGASIFDNKPGPRKVDRSEERIAILEAKLAKKDQVIAELLEEHVALKKSLGES
jgi:transposase-like protein